MPFTLVGFQGNVTPVAGAVPVPAILDQHITVVGNDLFVPPLNKLLAEYNCGNGVQASAQLQSPSLRRLALYNLAVLEQAGHPVGEGAFLPHFNSPIPLDVNEMLEAWIDTDPRVNVNSAVLCWLADDVLKPVNGAMISVKFTATLTPVLGQWINAPIAFDQMLPVGKYQIVGANVGGDATTGIAFRFVIPGYQWRPGGLCYTVYGTKPPDNQLFGGMGVWAEFDSQTPPTIDYIASTLAAQTIIGYLNLIKTG